MKVAALLLVFVVGAFAACDPDPDHTNEGIFYQSCKAGEVLVVNSYSATNDDGTTNYPVKVTAPINVMINFTNTGSQPLDNIFISASIARYTDIFGICSWIGIPTFGLTDHLDVCHSSPTPICPLKPGVNIFKQKIDLSPFDAIINLLSVTEPYRVTLSFTIGSTEIACAVIEAKIQK